MKTVGELKQTVRKGITATSAADLSKKSFDEGIDVAAEYYLGIIEELKMYPNTEEKFIKLKQYPYFKKGYTGEIRFIVKRCDEFGEDEKIVNHHITRETAKRLMIELTALL